MIDELGGRGRRAPLIVADCGYADNAEFRALDAWRRALETLEQLGHPDADQARAAINRLS
ncbi:hypothetical protein [Phytohabitans aurantiacus]|uniref:Transposase IS701-like DDE domain-containing protein n=1 Tax=Phytohabitans aurantiacus TaxID=3016789 RepID=A0ABQ5R5S9_9ACTN|nr:hypothetical protein [Phytohabitans aurantiacus]GLI01723.1 hypothetical protein Pa4123_69990 [Phytohabitans aurantiacus]